MFSQMAILWQYGSLDIWDNKNRFYIHLKPIYCKFLLNKLDKVFIMTIVFLSLLNTSCSDKYWNHAIKKTCLTWFYRQLQESFFWIFEQTTTLLILYNLNMVLIQLNELYHRSSFVVNFGKISDKIKKNTKCITYWICRCLSDFVEILRVYIRGHQIDIVTWVILLNHQTQKKVLIYVNSMEIPLVT
jgi:hypothetical protein